MTAGTTTLSGSNTYLGGTDVSGGVLTASAANAFSPGGETFTLIATHGTVDLGGFAQTINSVDLDGGTLQHGSLTGAVLSGGGAISGLSGSATVTTEDGVTTLSGVNSYTGATTVGATLTASAANAFSSASVTTISVAGIVNLGGFAQAIHTVNLSGGGLANGSLAGAVSSTGGYIDGLGGSATLTTTGGTTMLSTIWGPNTYTGATTVNGGVLTADNVNAFSPASVMTISIAGEVDLGAREQTINTVYLSGGAFGDGSLTSANGIISTGGSVTSLGGSTALTANGGVTALLSNTYTGATTINSGATVTGYTASAFSPNSALTINAGGVADLGGYNQTVASLSGSGIVTNSVAGAAVLTTGGDNTSTTFGGLISDGTGRTGLAKTGTGSLSDRRQHLLGRHERRRRRARRGRRQRARLGRARPATRYHVAVRGRRADDREPDRVRGPGRRRRGRIVVRRRGRIDGGRGRIDRRSGQVLGGQRAEAGHTRRMERASPWRSRTRPPSRSWLAIPRSTPARSPTRSPALFQARAP